jgi:hypothetical protein
MTTEDATAWLERRADQLRSAEPVEKVTVRELRPRRRSPVWLVHVMLRSHKSDDWRQLLEDLARDLRRVEHATHGLPRRARARSCRRRTGASACRVIAFK